LAAGPGPFPLTIGSFPLLTAGPSPSPFFASSSLDSTPLDSSTIVSSPPDSLSTGPFRIIAITSANQDAPSHSPSPSHFSCSTCHAPQPPNSNVARFLLLWERSHRRDLSDASTVPS
jgi:hypothetical protein